MTEETWERRAALPGFAGEHMYFRASWKKMISVQSPGLRATEEDSVPTFHRRKSKSKRWIIVKG